MRTRGFLLALLILSILLTYGSGFYATAYMVSVITVALVLAFVWSRLNIRWLSVAVTRPKQQVQVGDVYQEEVIITNRSKLPVAWVTVEDLGNLPGHALGRALGVGAETFRSWRSETRCAQRGLFTLGPVRLSSSDPLGIFTTRKTIGGSENILVYPATRPIPGFTVSTAEHMGESESFVGTQAITANVSGVRQYELGDSLNKVHWKSTAKHGKLMVKEFDVERQGSVWVLLDLQKDVQEGEGAESTAEYAITAAASVVVNMLAQDVPVGLVMSGDTDSIIYPEKGAQQRFQVLEALARVQATGKTPLSSLLARLGRQIGPGNSLVVVSPSPDEVQGVASFVMRRGIPSAAVVVDQQSFGGRMSGAGLVANLARIGLSAYLVRKGDDISDALSYRGTAEAMALANS